MNDNNKETNTMTKKIIISVVALLVLLGGLIALSTMGKKPTETQTPAEQAQAPKDATMDSAENAPDATSEETAQPTATEAEAKTETDTSTQPKWAKDILKNHKYGTGVECQSEFPKDWDESKIINTIQNIAANTALPWRRESNNYFVTEFMDGSTNVRVVLDPKREKVITAYPVNIPRNNCPADEAAEKAAKEAAEKAKEDAAPAPVEPAKVETKPETQVAPESKTEAKKAP